MGFPSPALDFAEKRVSLDDHCITVPHATYLVRAAGTHWHAGIMSGALLVVDSSKLPCDGSIVVGTVQGEFRVLRFRKVQNPHLEEIDHPEKKFSLLDDFEDDGIFGVVTWILNDARSGEFDDVPVM